MINPGAERGAYKVEHGAVTPVAGLEDRPEPSWV